MEKRKNGLGIAGFIFALIGFLVCLLSLIPLLGTIIALVGLVFCGIGFLLSFIGVFLKNRKKGLAIVGILLAIAGYAFYFTMLTAYMG